MSSPELRRPPPPTGAASACLWLRGVAPSVHERQLVAAFQQFGLVQRVTKVRDPITRTHTGHAVVQFESAERAARVAENLEQRVFVLGGTPRPLQLVRRRSWRLRRSC
jgi:RNA recognition motif-containing protein